MTSSSGNRCVSRCILVGQCEEGELSLNVHVGSLWLTGDADLQICRLVEGHSWCMSEVSAISPDDTLRLQLNLVSRPCNSVLRWSSRARYRSRSAALVLSLFALLTADSVLLLLCG